MSVVIQTKNLVKTYGLLPVLRKLNLEIERGQFVALLGPNGSGKSTLLRLLTGLSRPTAGGITVGGWSMPEEAAAVRAQMGMVSHKPLLYENLTATENLRFFAQLYNLPAKQISKHIDDMLHRVGLEKRGDDLVRTFSRGMQQRLSIARALLHDPAILLFDEPYTGLDQVAAATLDELLDEARRSTQTIIMATHQLERAARTADRVVILSRGRVAYDDAGHTLDAMALMAAYTEATGAATTR
jgi:heme exporter protein A